MRLDALALSVFAPVAMRWLAAFGVEGADVGDLHLALGQVVREVKQGAIADMVFLLDHLADSMPLSKIPHAFLRLAIKSVYFWYALVLVGENPRYLHQ